ncbi:MAG: DUF1015 domain-containing protein [Dehalococcoidales bacterium]|nr:DUF1015 domain-containing protein [Dehalococcoidales bacterium]
MADVLPFRGLRYNQALIKDLSNVICPPYDIIPPALHAELNRRDLHNFIRIEDAESSPRDSAHDNKYTRASMVLQQWLKDGVLKPEKQPAIYIDDHYFTVNGKTQMRRGIIARVRLEEWENGIVKPHENVIAVHVSDRINVLRQVQVNTSPVLSMYQDKTRALAKLLAAQEKLTPVMDATLPEGERHVIRAVTDTAIVKQISQHFTGQPLYVADGHHRYTSALAYRREKMAAPGATPDDACNFIMMTLVDFDDPGLVILAPHRALHNLSPATYSGFVEKLQTCFDLLWLPLTKPGVWQEVDTLQGDNKFVRIACLEKGAASVLVMTLRQPEKLAETMPYFKNPIYRKLDVSIVDNIILEKVLGLTAGFSDESKISYVVDRQDTVNKLLKGEYQMAFFVKPVNPELIKEVSDAGVKMPRKSTYFYPKAPAGLVVNTLY